MEEKMCACGVACDYCGGNEEGECSCSDNGCDCEKCAAKRNNVPADQLVQVSLVEPLAPEAGKLLTSLESSLGR